MDSDRCLGIVGFDLWDWSVLESREFALGAPLPCVCLPKVMGGDARCD